MSELLMLDVRTMAFASGVGGFLMAATMAGIFLAGMRSRALVDWAIAGMAYGLGYLLGHVLQTIAVPMPGWIGSTIANALILLGHGMVLVGVQRYLGLKCVTWIVLGLFVVMLLSGFVFVDLRDSLRLRVIFHSSVYIVVNGWAGWLLWRAYRPGMRRFHRAVALVLLLFAGLLTARLAYAVFSPALTTSFVQNPFQIGAFLAAMIFSFCLTMALVVMMFREKQVELMDLAEKDPLTGMNNRLALDEIAERHLQRAALADTDLSAMLFDIDHFKRINDEMGHQAGDKALAAIADRVRDVIRDNDIAFRFGGEEFIVLLPGANLSQAMRVAERLRRAIGSVPLEIDGERVCLTVSIGVIESRPGQDSWDECVRQADLALYQAKYKGRDRVESASGSALSTAKRGYVGGTRNR